MANTTWVNNKTADRVVADVKQALAVGAPSQASLQQLMDLVAGVQSYSTKDHRRQGIIRGIFDKESEKFKSGSRYRASNFSLDLDDVISTFWENVLKYLPRAATTGDTVSVRLVEGQEGQDARATNCNPVYYLRKMGVMGVRNLVQASYRRNLIQVCDQCGESSNVKRVETNGDNCPECKSTKLENRWPDGNAAYRTRKMKECQECKTTWIRKFSYSCQLCRSNEVHIESRYGSVEDLVSQPSSDRSSAEDELVLWEAEKELDQIVKDIYRFLPSDPRDASLVSRTKEIFTILVDPNASTDICRKCVAAAPKICAEQCGRLDCTHPTIPDPKISCGATSFSINKCINFSRKIGEYHNCSASLSARRIKKIRQYFVRFVKSNRNLDLCRSLYVLLDERGLLSQY